MAGAKKNKKQKTNVLKMNCKLRMQAVLDVKIEM